MKRNWENVAGDGSIVIGPERMPRKAELLEAFERAVSANGWEFVAWVRKDRAPYQCVLRHGGDTVDVVVFLKRISNAGWEHKPQCKRVQVTNLRQAEQLILRRESARRINLIIGYYDYERPLFAAWDARRYVAHETVRSCYVDAEQLSSGYREGFVETECFGLPVTVFTPERMSEYLTRYVAGKGAELASPAISYDAVKRIGMLAASTLASEPVLGESWDGRRCVEEMKARESSNWRQTEWPGWYFEESAIKILQESRRGFVPGEVSYGNTVFDLFYLIPWDLKAHSSGVHSDEIQANSAEAMRGAIRDYGYVGFIVLEGEPVPDDDGSFKTWHDEFKGGPSQYSLSRAERGAPSRKLKRGFIPQRITAYVIDEETFSSLPDFQTGMRNSNGQPRAPKKKLKISELPARCLIAEQVLHVVAI